MYQQIKAKILQFLNNPNARVVIIAILVLIAAMISSPNDHGGY